MLSSWYPVNSIENLELNTRWDGVFHSATYLFVLIGLYLLWRAAHRRHLYWSTKLFFGTMLWGFGIFNTVEGTVDHHLLGIHHVNETVARQYWPIWDAAFTLWGVSMILIGWLVMRAGQRGTPNDPLNSRRGNARPLHARCSASHVSRLEPLAFWL
jgi:uncharacterized membrane protein